MTLGIWIPTQGVSAVAKRKVPGIRQLVEDHLANVCCPSAVQVGWQ